MNIEYDLQNLIEKVKRYEDAPEISVVDLAPNGHVVVVRVKYGYWDECLAGVPGGSLTVIGNSDIGVPTAYFETAQWLWSQVKETLLSREP